MALQSSGQISLFNIRTEKGLAGQVSLSSLSTTSLNTYSSGKPDTIAPHRLQEFYGYQHIASLSSDAVYDNSNQGNLYWTLTAGYATQYRLQTYDSNTSSWNSGSWQSLPYNNGGRTNSTNTGGSIGISYLFSSQRIEFDILDSSSRYLYSVSWSG